MQIENFEYLIYINKPEYCDGIGRGILRDNLKIAENELIEEDEKFVSFRFPFKKELLRYTIMGKLFMVVAKMQFNPDDENV